jgi:GNAT superfamily N-acetyltransferase
VLQELDTAERVASAWPVVRQLRPHLDESALVAAWQRQREEGYRALGAFDDDGACRGFAGFRVQQMLAHGRFLYVDDLVTDEAVRGSGVGRRMMDWLQDEARRLGCASLQLDSGVQRHAAHGFYFARGLHITGYHFRTGG